MRVPKELELRISTLPSVFSSMENQNNPRRIQFKKRQRRLAFILTLNSLST
ncbi:hypothetical protein C1H46_000298 [Malus baccata]|uniref:Uncharacterized protein n=1 Tax=Malus baccata TaxID=106549 RepID=A0A540NTN5_MALBA|nr:hypothetical protein C1H46_000298 [Malus baccata]